MFDLDADWSAIADGLRHDPELAAQMEAEPGLRVPGCWDGFELTIRAILGQQVTVKGATTLAGVIARSLGKPFFGTHGLTHCFPTPQVLATANLVRLGVTRAKARAIRSLARAVCEGHIGFQRVIHYDELLARLTELPGIGSWTSQYVAMRALGEPDAFPTGDLGLLRALGLRRACDLEHRAEAWRPWRAYAAMYLWSMAGNNKLAGPDLRSQKGSKDVSAADSTEGIAAWM